MHVAYGAGSVLLWWRCDTLCTSVFVDDVMFSRSGPVARRVYCHCQASIEYENHNSRDCNQILLNTLRTSKCFSRVEYWGREGAKSVICDCLVDSCEVEARHPVGGQRWRNLCQVEIYGAGETLQ